MSDYFTKFEAELRRAAASRASSSRGRRLPLRPLLVAAVLVLAAVPAVAAVTGAFKGERAPRHLAPGSSAALTPPCKGPAPFQSPHPSNGPVPAAITRLLAPLRRPQRAADELPATAIPHAGPVISRGVRLLYTDRDHSRYYLVPTQNAAYNPAVPNTPECAAIRRALRRPVAAGVCIWHVGGPLPGGSCMTAAQLRRRWASSPDQGFTQGMTPGTMYVSGLATDGVEAVLLRYPKRAPVRTVRIPVRANIYAAVIRGRPELMPAVYAQSADGVRLVQRGQQPESSRQRALNRRSKQRDLHATSTPTVVPPIGRPHTTFTFRVRLAPLHGSVYVVRVTGPPGLCHQALKPYGFNPAAGGRLGGLIKLGIGYGPLGLHKMCVGSYHGVLTRVRNGAPTSSGVVVRRFGFEVRTKP